MEDPDYREVARATFEGYREIARISATLQSDHAKWLITTMAATHVGGIYLLVSMEGVAPAAKLPGVEVLVWGLCLSFGCGLFTYLNFEIHRSLYVHWCDPAMLVSREAWPKDRPWYRRGILATMWAAILLGVASVACLPLATYVTARAMHLE